MTMQVLYVGGLGRSGSTLLDLLLGSTPGACSVGELTHIWTRGVDHDERCGCGEAFHACAFWRDVGRRAFDGWDAPAARRAVDLHHRVDRNRYIPLMLLPWLSPGYRRRLEEYTAALGALYGAIAGAAGTSVVVDSSKHASTAFLLRHVAGVDVRVVHLVRDSRGVGHSWSKVVRKPEVVDRVALMDRVPPTRIAIRWLVYNALFHLLAWLGTPTTRVHYEDFADDPHGHARRIRRQLGPSPWARDAQRPHVARLGGAHTVAGNPVRFHRGEVDVRRDDAWRTALPRRDRWLISAITWPLALAYGYFDHGRRSTGRSRTVDDDVAPGSARRPSPAVSVVVATHDRPVLVREAIDAVLAQDYDGLVEVVVVYDRTEPDASLEQWSATRRVRVLRNHRRPGLAGARNSGVEAAVGEFVAFCDDDDRFLPGKLRVQVDALTAAPDHDVAIGSIRINVDDRHVRSRRPPGPVVTLDDLVGDRVTAAHPSTVMVRHDAFWTRIGPVDEHIPGSYAEDYEWLLRAAGSCPVLVVPEAVSEVRWGSTSLFADRWATMCDAIDYLVERHPSLRDDARGLARLYGRKAFAHAALGDAHAARTWARRAWSLNHRERRAYVAWLASTGTVRPETLLRLAHAHGRGI